MRVCVCVCSAVQSYPAPRGPMDCSLPGSSVHRMFQASILDWAAIAYSKGTSDPGIETESLPSPALAGGFLYQRTTS